MPPLRELSTSTGYQVEVGNRTLQYNNTNRLVKNPAWEIGLQKTGYITEAGQCLVMQAKIAGRKLIMVFPGLCRQTDSYWQTLNGFASGSKRGIHATSAPSTSPLALRGFEQSHRRQTKKVACIDRPFFLEASSARFCGRGKPRRLGDQDGRFLSAWAASRLPIARKALKSTGLRPICLGRRRCLRPYNGHPIRVPHCHWLGHIAGPLQSSRSNESPSSVMLFLVCPCRPVLLQRRSVMRSGIVCCQKQFAHGGQVEWCSATDSTHHLHARLRSLYARST